MTAAQLTFWGPPVIPSPARRSRRPSPPVALPPPTDKPADPIPAGIPPRGSRRTCPACARRYAGLVAPECPVCAGLGTLGLGAAALATAEPAAVARAVELYLEARAAQARATLPYVQHQPAVEAAVLDLHAAGVLSTAADRSTAAPARRHPQGPVADSVAETKAARIAANLGAPPTAAVARALSPENTVPLDCARRRRAEFPSASATGHLSALCQVADPIDPLGPDVAVLAVDRDRRDHTAAVIAAATADLSEHRRRTAPRVRAAAS